MPPSIPLPYRILLLYFEPLAALNGALLSHFAPSYYLLGMSPLATPSTYSAVTQIIFDQLAACYFLFAWNEAVVLRCTNDLRVWKAVVLGILICDIVHFYGFGQAVGWGMGRWRVEEWVNFVMLVGPGGMRGAFLMGVGLGGEGKGVERKEL